MLARPTDISLPLDIWHLDFAALNAAWTTEYGTVNTVVVLFETSGLMSLPPSCRERPSTSRSPSKPERCVLVGGG